MQDVRGSHILIVDDVTENLQVLANMLIPRGFIVSTATGPDKALKFLSLRVPDLILLDVNMPEMNGFELCRLIKANHQYQSIPIIFLTARTQTEDIIKGFEAGSVDYVTKPFNQHELEARIVTHLRLKKYQAELELKNQLLEDREKHLLYLVDEKTRNIEQITIAMTIALESANFFNDEVTGNHIRRVSEYSVVLAQTIGCDQSFINRIRMYSSLHDIGKIGVPVELLKRPGPMTPSEFEEMKKHVEIGAKILSHDYIDPMARNIALYHHEWWNGQGYLKGLKKEAIPLEARIVALADVYDALVTKRPYKEPWVTEKAVELIMAHSGTQFQPELAEAFYSQRSRFKEIVMELP